MPNDYSHTIGAPDPRSINSGLHAVTSNWMLDKLGRPGKLTEDCSPITNPRLAEKISTRHVGPFTVTGHKLALNELAHIFAQVKSDNHDLYEQIGTAGMLCCRHIRGFPNEYSNHSFGLAIDLTINGQLEPLGSPHVQIGMLALYPYFHRMGWYWGASFPRRDSMHMEWSKEKITKHLKELL